jgi:diguanylate cyclase (GGDEF)-like protein
MDSKIGLIVQLTGVFLITILSLFLRRSLKVVALKYWTMAWLCLSFALICLRLAFSYDDYSNALFSFYFLGEYVFGFLLVIGCRSLERDYRLNFRHELVILPFMLMAFALPYIAKDFNLIFNIHSLIMSAFFGASFLALKRSTTRTFGWRVMNVALALLAIDFLQYFVVFTLRQFFEFNTDYLAYNPLIDLVMQMMMGFGMVIVLLEEVLTDFQKANAKLQMAHEKLEQIAHVDPLTTAFTRHAFHGYVKKQDAEGIAVSGCVGFFDIDNLKPINDAYGHSAGDMAIRAVARAIRELIRPEDLIFRWGGDEFFVMMIGLGAEAANNRMKRIEDMLTDIMIEGAYRPLTIGVSRGFTDFTDFSELEKAMNAADAEMYRLKQERKKAGEEKPGFVLPIAENAPQVTV